MHSYEFFARFLKAAPCLPLRGRWHDEVVTEGVALIFSHSQYAVSSPLTKSPMPEESFIIRLKIRALSASSATTGR